MDVAATPSRRWARLLIFLLPAIAFIIIITLAVIRVDGPAPLGERAPAFSVPLLIGEGEVTLDDLAGKPVLLNFWASWCEPCKKEAPMLRKAQREFGDRIQIVAVNAKDARSEALDFAEQQRLEDLVLVRDEDSDMYEDFGLTGQPETFFIDSDGVVVEHVKGELVESTMFSLLDVLVERDG
jgi:cytochrome c biogenesis protein CcmG, thiol:disulfide interchange protein DsbE